MTSLVIVLRYYILNDTPPKNDKELINKRDAQNNNSMGGHEATRATGMEHFFLFIYFIIILLRPSLTR